jgi:hypothetical protein
MRDTTLIERAPEPAKLISAWSETVEFDVQSRSERMVYKCLTAPAASGHDV